MVTEESIKDGRKDSSNCPVAVSKILIIDDEELEKRKESRISPNTGINTSWAVCTWSEWVVDRNGIIAIKGGSGITLPQVIPDILNITDNEELIGSENWLLKFVRKRIQALFSHQTLFSVSDCKENINEGLNCRNCDKSFASGI